MPYSLTWLPQVLRAAGLKVAEAPGWAERGRGDMGAVLGVMCHHTATRNPNRLNMPTLALIRDGRSDLAGPLAQLGLGLDGTYYVIAAGRANHAGPGEWRGVTGNSRFIGIEAENSGLAADQPWPEVQMEAYRRGVAAILTRIGASADMCCGHKEYAPGRKPDPLFDMKAFREGVAGLMNGSVAPRPPIPAVSVSTGRPTLRRGGRGEHVVVLQRAVGADPADGIFGPTTEAKLRQFQRAHDLVPDGIAGPKTWDAIAGGQGGPVQSPPPSAGGGQGSALGQSAAAGGIITPELLQAVAPDTPAETLAALVAPLSAACAKFEIDTPVRVAAFLSQCAHESGGFMRREENLKYSAKRMTQVWPSKFPDLQSAQAFAGKAEALANKVYANIIGNGGPESGDGWRFRGRGFKQLTGRANYKAFADAAGKTLDETPDYLMTDEGACMSGAWFWRSKNLNALADARDVAALTKKINGGKIGLAQRTALFQSACKALGI